jgi:hypothetical protein
MMPRFLPVAVLLVVLCSVSLLHAQETEVRAAALRFLEAFNHLDWPAFEANFDATAAIFHPSDDFGSRIEGRALLMGSFREIFGEVLVNRPGPPYLNISPEASTFRCSVRVPQSSPSIRMEGPLGRRRPVCVRREEEWLIAHLHASIVSVPPGADLTITHAPFEGEAERRPLEPSEVRRIASRP